MRLGQALNKSCLRRVGPLCVFASRVCYSPARVATSACLVSLFGVYRFWMVFRIWGIWAEGFWGKARVYGIRVGLGIWDLGF